MYIISLETHLELFQTSMMERFETSEEFQPLNVYAKTLHHRCLTGFKRRLCVEFSQERLTL